MSIKITGLQQAQDAIQKELAKIAGNKFVLVGIHEDAGMAEGEEFTMATLGAVQHYGNDRIPARRWLDVGVEEGTKEYLEIIQEGIASGESQERTLEKVGASAAGYAQQYMRDLKNPPNAPSTIKKKGSANPLIDTGRLVQSVTYTVTSKSPEEGL